MANFDEAKGQSEDLFDEKEVNAGEQTPLEEENAESMAENTPIPSDEAAEEPERTDKENEMLRAENEELKADISELSKKNEELIIKNALKMPEPDFEALSAKDETVRHAAQEKYTREILEYSRDKILEEISPAIEFAKREMEEHEKAEVIDALDSAREFSGIKEAQPKLDKMIERYEFLKGLPTDERYVLAYIMSLGVDSINGNNTDTTREEFLKLYTENPDFQELVEELRREKIKDSQQVPPFSASSGAGGAALHIEEKPQSMNEASERAAKLFNLIKK